MNRTAAVALAAAVIAGLAWIDPVYIPMILLGPLVTGVVAGTRGIAPRVAALPWLLAGLVTLVVDFAVNGEDVAFHLVVALFTAAMALGVTAAVRGLAGRRRASSAQA